MEFSRSSFVAGGRRAIWNKWHLCKMIFVFGKIFKTLTLKLPIL